MLIVVSLIGTAFVGASRGRSWRTQIHSSQFDARQRREGLNHLGGKANGRQTDAVNPGASSRTNGAFSGAGCTAIGRLGSHHFA